MRIALITSTLITSAVVMFIGNREIVASAAIVALAVIAVVSVYLPVFYGLWGFPLALGIWAGTVIAAGQVALWAWGSI